MAQRRMVSKAITEKTTFLKMPLTAQALYFHLNTNADDEGIVEAYKVMRMLGTNEDDLRVLATRRFITILNEDLVTYILDWNEHNIIRADRKIKSVYQDLLIQVVPEADIKEPKPRADTGKYAGGQPLDVHMTAQYRIGEDRREEDREGEVKEGKREVSKKETKNTKTLNAKSIIDMIPDGSPVKEQLKQKYGI